MMCGIHGCHAYMSSICRYGVDNKKLPHETRDTGNEYGPQTRKREYKEGNKTAPSTSLKSAGESK